MINKKIYVDAWNPAQQIIDVTQGEVSGRFVVVHLFNNGAPLDLTGSVVSVYGTKPDGKLVLNSCEILDPAMGVISVPMNQQMSISPGEYSDSGLQIIKGESVLKVRAFRIIVWPAADYDSIAESTDEFTALQQALRDVDRVTQSGLTEAGKQEIVEAMLAELPTWNGGSY